MTAPVCANCEVKLFHVLIFRLIGFVCSLLFVVSICLFIAAFHFLFPGSLIRLHRHDIMEF